LLENLILNCIKIKLSLVSSVSILSHNNLSDWFIQISVNN